MHVIRGGNSWKAKVFAVFCIKNVWILLQINEFYETELVYAYRY